MHFILLIIYIQTERIPTRAPEMGERAAGPQTAWLTDSGRFPSGASTFFAFTCIVPSYKMVHSQATRGLASFGLESGVCLLTSNEAGETKGPGTRVGMGFVTYVLAQGSRKDLFAYETVFVPVSGKAKTYFKSISQSAETTRKRLPHQNLERKEPLMQNLRSANALAKLDYSLTPLGLEHRSILKSD